MVAWRGGADTAALTIADGEHLVSVCADQDTLGRYVHAVDVEGSAQDCRCDLYEQACVILAYSALLELTGEARWSAAAFEAVSHVREGLAHLAGGYCEGAPATCPRPQKPHMHMLEAYLALFEATGNPLARRGGRNDRVF